MSLVNHGGNNPMVETIGRDAEFPPWYLRRTARVVKSFEHHTIFQNQTRSG